VEDMCTRDDVCWLVCPSRMGPVEEPGTLTEGAPVSLVPLVWRSFWESNPIKTPGWLVQDRTTSPAHRESGAHQGRGFDCMRVSMMSDGVPWYEEEQ
jgi:hypothetical protein